MMITFLSSLTIITLLSGSSGINAQESAVQGFSKIWKPTKKGTYVIPGILRSIFTEDENSFLYAQCNNTGPLPSCIVTKETWPFKEGTYKTKCEYTNELIRYGIHMYVLPQHRVLIRSVIERSTTLQILDMSTCNVTDVKADDDAKFHYSPPVLHRNGFEMLLNNNDCEDKPSCLIWNSYDLNGKKVNNLRSFVHSSKEEYIESMPASHDSPEKGFYMYIFDMIPRRAAYSKHYHEVIYVDSTSSGTVKKVLHEPLKNPRVNPFRTTAFSNAHDRYSICWYELAEPREVHCAQFDTGIQKLNVTLKLSEDVQWIAVHNVADGGLLVATGDCENPDFGQTKLCRGYRVQKISSNGVKSKALYIDGLQYPEMVPNDYSYKTLITENSKDQYCFILASSLFELITGKMIYEKQCIPKTYIY